MATEKYYEKIINAEDGSEIVREYTPEQLAEVAANKVKSDELNAALIAKEAAQAAICEKLGITLDEAKFLLS